MSNVEQDGASKLDHSASFQFWNFKENNSLVSIRGDGKENDERLRRTSISRSSSYTHLPSRASTLDLDAPTGRAGIKRTFSENLLTNLDNGILRRNSLRIPENGAPEGSKNHKLTQQKSGRFRRELKNAGSNATVTEKQSNQELAELPKALVREKALDRELKLRSVSGSLSSLARKSWIGNSRSPSPSKRQSTTSDLNGNVLQNAATGVSVVNLEEAQLHKSQLENSVVSSKGFPTLQRKVTTSKKSKRPLSIILGKSAPGADEDRPAIPPISKSFSYDKLALSWHKRPGLDISEGLPRSASTDRMHSLGSESPRKRDDLWSAFRTLDAEFQKFLSKSSMVKANIVRNALLPFLKAYADHHCNTSLRAEDLDRRVSILNRWWGGLLEMLSGRNGHSVSGNDRPVILDAITGIMGRPEWRLPVSAIYSRVDKPRPPLKSRSSTSLESTSSDFLAESIFHHVRNVFVQNLLLQMTFVVERMAMRSVPASVVSFCGKATAYAFFFCPGVAEILVRLWSVSVDLVRRVLDEMKISKFVKLNEVAEKIAIGFPLHLRGLSFKSLPLLMKHLRCRPQLILDASHIPWYGAWVGRWLGRDSDLFFVFVKHHHILISDMLLDDVSRVERACAPSFVLVQAQLLSVLDTTIHRAVNRTHAEAIESALSIPFDNILGADVPATPLPLPAPNAARMMAENRLIMLLRELLSETSGVQDVARKSFAESFENMMKAAARRTSMFDHNACFALCDFLEEATTILVRYFHDPEDPISFLDWKFWKGVWEQMMNSNNSMTEVRLYALIYGLWSLIAKKEERKKQITLEWLLTGDHFQRQFSHWCPTVRAYYMRLLCWRIARCDGEGSETDFSIYTMLSLRLQQIWHQFICTQELAIKNGLSSPSTTPCNPAPGRRLLIVRNDMLTGAGGTFLTFDSILAASASAGQPTAYERHSSLNSLKDTSDITTGRRSPRSSSPARKRWSLLRNINPFTSVPVESIRINGLLPDSGIDQSQGNQPELTKGPPNGKLKPELPTTPNVLSPQLSSQAQNLSFKFSLEWNDRSGNAPRDRKLHPPRLPLPAQIFLQSKQMETRESVTSKLDELAEGPSRYSGRALSEWTALVNECQNFFERRKYEGVVGLKRVETPSLGVEAFRRPG